MQAQNNPEKAPLDPQDEEAAFHERLHDLAPIPWLTYLLIAANALICVVTLFHGAGLLQAPADKLLLWGGNTAAEVQSGEWWRLLTATFLHNGFMHMFMNMLGLFSIGLLVERIYGHRLFLLIYLGSGLIGSALSLHFTAQKAVSVGASGAVFGVMGALLVAVLQHRDKLPQAFGKETLSSLGIFIVYSLIQGFTQPGIDNAAHVGGLLGGGLLALILPERFDMAHFTQHFKRRAIGALVVVATATVGLAMLAPHTALEQKKLFEGNAAFLRGFNNFNRALIAIQQEQLDVQTGRLSERESDERSRTLFAPMFRAVREDLSRAALPASDPRQPILKDIRRMTDLYIESLEMESVYPAGSEQPEPADPQRMAAILAELRVIGAHVHKLKQHIRPTP